MVIYATVRFDHNRYRQLLANEPGSLNSRSDFYVSVEGLYAIEDFDSSSRLNFDSAAGFNLRLGYRFHPYFTIETMGERALI